MVCLPRLVCAICEYLYTHAAPSPFPAAARKQGLPVMMSTVTALPSALGATTAASAHSSPACRSLLLLSLPRAPAPESIAPSAQAAATPGSSRADCTALTCSAHPMTRTPFRTSAATYNSGRLCFTLDSDRQGKFSSACTKNPGTGFSPGRTQCMAPDVRCFNRTMQVLQSHDLGGSRDEGQGADVSLRQGHERQ